MAAETVLLLGNYRPTLTLARRLKPRGHRIIVTPGEQDGFAELSRDVDGVWDHPDFDSDTAFVRALRDHLKDNPDIGVVMPVAESFSQRLERLWDQLPEGPIYATPAPDIVRRCLDKTCMLHLAQASEVPCAAFAMVNDHGALLEAARRLGPSVVIRPECSTRTFDGERVLVFDDIDDLAREVPAFPAGHETVIVQRYVTGPRHNIYFAAQNGRAIRFLAARIERTHRANGTGLAVEGVTIPLRDDIRAHCERLLKALDYTGVGCVQFIVDDAAEIVSFLEINPRIAGNHAIAEACGLDLSGLAIDLARPETVDTPLFIGPAGVRYAWSYGELRGLRAAIGSGSVGIGGIAASLGQALWTALTADVHMTWSWRDPLPSLALLACQVPIIRRFWLPAARKRISRAVPVQAKP